MAHISKLYKVTKSAISPQLKLRSLPKQISARVVNARTRDETCARVLTTRARISAQILMKIFVVVVVVVVMVALP